jgi:hypothetical protein
MRIMSGVVRMVGWRRRRRSEWLVGRHMEYLRCLRRAEVVGFI